jgi:hypothetical protein
MYTLPHSQSMSFGLVSFASLGLCLAFPIRTFFLPFLLAIYSCFLPLKLFYFEVSITVDGTSIAKYLPGDSGDASVRRVRFEISNSTIISFRNSCPRIILWSSPGKILKCSCSI